MATGHHIVKRKNENILSSYEFKSANKNTKYNNQKSGIQTIKIIIKINTYNK